MTALGSRFSSRADATPVSGADQQDISAETRFASSTTNVVFWVGLGLLLSTNGVIFSACFLATKFSQLNDPVLGAIAGVVIWSAYCLGLTWASSTAVGTAVGAVLGAATGGLRQLIAALRAVFRNQDNTSMSQEEIAAAVQQEIQLALGSAALDRWPSHPAGDRINQSEISETDGIPEPLPLSLEDVNLHLGQELALYLRHTRLKRLTPDRIYQKLQELLDKALENSSYPADQLTLDRTQLKAVLKERQGWDKPQRRQVLQAVETAWRQLTAQANPPFPEDRQQESPRSRLDAFQPIAAYITEAIGKLDDQLSDPDLELETRLKQHLSEGLTFSTAATLVVLHQLNRINWDALLDRLPLDRLTVDSVGQGVSNLRSNAQELMHQPQQWTEEVLLPQTQGLKHLVVQQVEQFEQGLQARVDTLKAQAQERLTKTRKAATAAAWWLAITAFTTAGSAAIAGALAAGMHVPFLGF
ncbi:hypothetical protein H6F75_02225 [Nodosilinea sp. FACHB-131]|uniref:hypothetical protein n=1 Tax=Cyanophyceae TaxID=3028117 RepID=UPI001689F6A4|nr:hypothetical protein [Nodosilinea sp. FACHB-131]MBD1872286.1 hypothetical protein [Nodosilinea sp. FACHB-131]